MFETICRVVTGDIKVHCTEKSSFPFHLPFFDERLGQLVAASWQCHGNQMSSFLKASVYPDDTTTPTQRFHIYAPQRSFLKSIVFSVGFRRFSEDGRAKRLNIYVFADLPGYYY